MMVAVLVGGASNELLGSTSTGNLFAQVGGPLLDDVLSFMQL